jgi:NTE family protein
MSTLPQNRYNPKAWKISLLLQGGGALGAYQAGVYQALHESDLMPQWVVGTSIGAINAALIAGNPPQMRLDRLKQFWDRLSHADWSSFGETIGGLERFNAWMAIFDAFVWGVPGFFRPNSSNFLFGGASVPPEMAGFYDTRPLLPTLQELIDFDYLNAPGGMRLTVNAMNVCSGELVNFDSTRQTITADHIRASGALPPGLPAVRIDGDLYWDGGLYSNTPLETVFCETPTQDALCFMVDLWSGRGAEPTSFAEVSTRKKDVTFASRSNRHIKTYLDIHALQCHIAKLHALLSEHLQVEDNIDESIAYGCRSLIHIVHLPYTASDWHMPAKDVNFSRGSLQWRWEQGYSAAMRAINTAAWLDHTENDVGLVVHEPSPLPELKSVQRKEDLRSNLHSK